MSLGSVGTRLRGGGVRGGWGRSWRGPQSRGLRQQEVAMQTCQYHYCLDNLSTYGGGRVSLVGHFRLNLVSGIQNTNLSVVWGNIQPCASKQIILVSIKNL